MDWKESVLPFVKEHMVALGFGVIGLVCLGYGFFSLRPQTPDPQFQSLDAPATATKIATPIPKQITIDVEGAVAKPGVYKIAADSRIQDAIGAAGGLSTDADHQQVAQNLNLASPLTDGGKLYIPAVGEQMMTSGMGSNGSSGTSVAGASTVNINQASEEALDALPGVGPVTAQKIIAGRPYQTVQDLLDKKVVGQSVFTKIKDQVTVY